MDNVNLGAGEAIEPQGEGVLVGDIDLGVGEDQP